MEKGDSNGPLYHGKESKMMLYIADLARSFSIVHRKLFWGARAEILLLCAEILPFLGFVQKYYCPGTTPSWEPVQGHFWACAEILVSRRNIHLRESPIFSEAILRSENV